MNLDPGNDKLPYPCAVDVMSLISLESVMDEHTLGPNGGLIYCMEYLEHNIEWLQDKLQKHCKGACPFPCDRPLNIIDTILIQAQISTSCSTALDRSSSTRTITACATFASGSKRNGTTGYARQTAEFRRNSAQAKRVAQNSSALPAQKNEGRQHATGDRGSCEG